MLTVILGRSEATTPESLWFNCHSGFSLRGIQPEGLSRIYYENMKNGNGYIYIMANSRPTLYTGVTDDLIERVFTHKHDLVEGFTSKYKLHKLVYYEVLENIQAAIIREKQIKDLNRKDKIKMIKKFNLKLEDLYQKLLR